MLGFLVTLLDVHLFPYLQSGRDSDFGVFLQVGNFEVRYYALCILLGALAALYKCKYELKKRNMPEDYYDNFFLSVLVISIIGARLWYIISQPDQFHSFADVIGWTNGHIELSGLAVQGGVLAGVAWGIFYFKKIKTRYPLALHVDLVVPNILLGQVIGRWGNFFNGEVFGKKVSRDTLWFIPSWIINNCTTGNTNYMGGLANVGNQAGYDMVNVPLFLIEGSINFIGFILISFVAWNLWKKYRKPYDIAALYFIWYGVVRLILEPLRVEQFIMTRTVFGIEVRTTIFMSIVYILIGVAVMILNRIFFKDKNINNMYVNEKEEAKLAMLKEKHDKELQAKIDAKKAEIRARRAKESESK